MIKVAASSVRSLNTPAPRFPAAWAWLIDEAIPTYVKKQYSPREAWKDRPFTKEDAKFFFRGIEELSDLFTDERPKNMPRYFNHPKYRSSYLLYFFPLQAAKFITLFQVHSAAIEAAIADGTQKGVLRVLDLGSGPGTASLAFLLQLLEHPDPASLPPIELHWFDTQKEILHDGKELAEMLGNNFSKLRGKIKVHTYLEPWWRAAELIKEPTSLTLFGHVLNETQGLAPLGSSGPNGDHENQFQSAVQKALNMLLTRAHGGGTLIVEPAFKSSAQLVSQLRDYFFRSEILSKEPGAIWGPCLHMEACPLAQGRDWCHFSIPLSFPGKWFAAFSKGLGSERQWIKFQYNWYASREYRAQTADGSLRRVVSDPLRGERGKSQVLLCEPELTRRQELSGTQKLWRGDLFNPRAPKTDRQERAPERGRDPKRKPGSRPPFKSKRVSKK